MSKFNGWKPKDKSGICIRFYLANSSGKAFVGKKGNRLVIEAENNSDLIDIQSTLRAKGIDISTMTLQELNNAMAENNLATFPADQQQNSGNFSAASGGKNKFEGNTKNAKELALESLGLNVESAPFRAGTLNNINIDIDAREPEAILSLFHGSKFDSVNIRYGHLELGDIRFVNQATGDVLLIERKTVTDFQRSIYSYRAHDQAERYFNEVQRLAALGQRMKVIWIVEGEKDGSRLLYNSLPKVQNVDGMLSYLTGVLDQAVFQTFNSTHTVYMALKFAQCFFEQQLFYKVQTHAPLANRSGKDRLALRNFAAGTASTDHGVTRPSNSVAAMLSYIPSIKKNVAEELAKSGKSFKDIICMSADEILQIKGVGEKSAKEIYNDFNRMQ